MSRFLLVKYVVVVIKYKKDFMKVFEMFRFVKNEEGFKYNLLIYKCMVDKFGYYGKFEEMEFLFFEMRMDIDNSVVEGVYIGVMKSYGRKGKV